MSEYDLQRFAAVICARSNGQSHLKSGRMRNNINELAVGPILAPPLRR